MAETLDDINWSIDPIIRDSQLRRALETATEDAMFRRPEDPLSAKVQTEEQLEDEPSDDDERRSQINYNRVTQALLVAEKCFVAALVFIGGKAVIDYGANSAERPYFADNGQALPGPEQPVISTPGFGDGDSSLERTKALPVPVWGDGKPDSYYGMSASSIGYAGYVTEVEEGGVRYSIECLVQPDPVVVQPGGSFYRTLGEAYGYDDLSYSMDAASAYRGIEAAIQYNIDRGVVESREDVLHPGDKLFAFRACIQTTFYPNGDIQQGPAGFAGGNDYADRHLWVYNPETGKAEPTSLD